MAIEWLETVGTIKYDPHRGHMKSNTKNWCVIEVDREITRYYRWWMQFEKHILLQQPSWDAHVSVVRGERLSAQASRLWKRHHGRKVTLRYQHGDICNSKDVDQPGFFHWIRVDCPEVDQIRQELNLPTSWKYHHLTIGRTYY